MSKLSKHKPSFGALLKPWAGRSLKLLRTVPVDVILLLALVAGLNLHLVGLGAGSAKIFLPRAVAEGEWWRVLTHPFVHVSGYHLFLDATAFFLLYGQLRGRPLAHRLVCLVSSAGVSLGAAIVAAPLIESHGLAGLSGTAHGLMVFCGMQMMARRVSRSLGGASVFLLIAKSVYEAATGQAFFAAIHPGNLGTSQVVCHLGGVAGGLAAFAGLAGAAPKAGSQPAHG